MKDINILLNNGVNVNQSLELFGDMETYDSMLQTFLDEVDEKLTNIKKYKEIGDMSNYAILVHSLKSDAKYFGFTRLAELSYEHELDSKANNFYKVCDTFDELMDEANKIVSIVKRYFGQDVAIEKIETKKEKDKCFLVVDDSNVISSFIEKIFKDEFDVIVAHDGNEAGQKLRENSKISGMLLDLNMPNVNGFAVLEYFKKYNLFERIPVSIITGVGNDELVNKAFNYPIVSILRKPFNERDIKAVVEKTVK